MKPLKLIALTVATLFSGILAYGQPQPTEASVMIDNANRNAVTITINQPDNITGDALRQRLQRSGLKDNVKDGVMSFKGIVLSEISAMKIDLYTKVEKGPNNSSVVYMAVSGADSLIIQNEKTFLASLVKDANDRYADVGISNRINDVKKDEKSYQKLLDEQHDLQKKKSKIESRLVEIQNELDLKTVDLDKKKTGVDDAKAARSNTPPQ